MDRLGRGLDVREILACLGARSLGPGEAVREFLSARRGGALVYAHGIPDGRSLIALGVTA